MNKFKNRLKELRDEKRLTQPQIAEALEINPYANWEQGRTEPDIDGIIILSKFFNVAVGYIVVLRIKIIFFT